jgi:hypothetical protein
VEAPEGAQLEVYEEDEDDVPELEDENGNCVPCVEVGEDLVDSSEA